MLVRLAEADAGIETDLLAGDAGARQRGRGARAEEAAPGVAANQRISSMLDWLTRTRSPMRRPKRRTWLELT